MIEGYQAFAVDISREHGFCMDSKRYICMANLLDLVMRAVKLTLECVILYLSRHLVCSHGYLLGMKS